MLPERLSSLSVETIAALVAELSSAREGLVAAAALAGIVTGLAFGALLGGWRLRRAMRAPLARLVALTERDDASPVPGALRQDLAGEVARAAERIAAAQAECRRREAALRAALDEAEARAAEADRRADASEARAQAAEARAEAASQRNSAEAALIASVAAVLAEELAQEAESCDRTIEEPA